MTTTSTTGREVHQQQASAVVLMQMAEYLASGKLDLADELLKLIKSKSMRSVQQSGGNESEFQQPQFTSQLAQLERRFHELRDQADRRRQHELLEGAERALADRDPVTAENAIRKVLTTGPTTESYQRAMLLRQQVETLVSANQQLQRGLKLLQSSQSTERLHGENLLLTLPASDFPSLAAALHLADSRQSPHLLALFTRLGRPRTVTPVMASLLARDDHVENWPNVLASLQGSQAQGAGAWLLEQVKSAPDSRRAIPYLQGLSVVSDPPIETFVALIPWICQDSPAQAYALMAAAHAVVTNRQEQIIAQQLEAAELSADDLQRLKNLPYQLRSLVQIVSDDATAQQLQSAAHRLAIVLKLQRPESLTGLSVYRVSSELPGSPAGALFDGVSNRVDLATMWRHPPRRLHYVVVDLGKSRTVTGVRLWNLNDDQQPHRGWRQVVLSIGETPDHLETITTFELPLAPGQDQRTDFSLTTPVRFAVGRYLRLQVRNLWRPDRWSGLSELEVLGF